MAVADRKCSLCGTLKAASAFSRANRKCNSCRNLESKEKANNSTEGFLAMRLSSLKQRHKNKNFSGETIDLPYLLDIYAVQNGICAVTGIPMHITTEESDLSVSPDRIDNTKGYIKGNVRLVCARANLMRSTLDDAHFHWWCRAVVNQSGN